MTTDSTTHPVEPVRYGPEPLDPTRPFLAREHLIDLFGEVRYNDYLDLRHSQLVEWTAAQPEGTVVGFTAKSTDCPCNRCLLDLGIAFVPEGYTLTVEARDAVIHASRGASYMWRVDALLPPWLQATIKHVDSLGAVTRPDGTVLMTEKEVTREQLLAILASPEVLSLVNEEAA